MGSEMCIRDSYTSFGIGKWSKCDITTTADVTTYLLPADAAPREIESDADRVARLYKGICAGCHAYNLRMIGPPAMAIQAQYYDNPQGIADYLANPVKKRPDFPPMPSQGHLSEELRLKVAEYMLCLSPKKLEAVAATQGQVAKCEQPSN